jgi:hypothetical protein
MEEEGVMNLTKQRNVNCDNVFNKVVLVLIN